ncbi:MAG: ATP-grasp domain-containing protein [Thermoplasmata archaeon]|nr:ATP-grasp domain-containing protein [Thermoplasmata archaeon]
MSCERLKEVAVMVTAAGAPGAVGIIQSLRAAKERTLTIVGTDMRIHASGRPFLEGFHQVPRGRDPGFIDAVIEACEDSGTEVIIPLSTEELLAFASEKERIVASCGAKVCVSSKKAIEIANEKARLFETLGAAGVPVPSHVSITSADELRSAATTLGYPHAPVCMKPSFAHGSRGFRVIEHGDDTTNLLLERKPENSSISISEAERLLTGLREPPEMLVMEYLPGREYSVDMLCSQGEMLVAVTRSRDEIRSGISFRGTVVNSPEAVSVCETICGEIDFDGPVGVQLREDADGALKVLEINPRLHGSVLLTVAAGVNLPYLAVKSCLGEPFTIPPINYGTRMSRYWGAMFHGEDGLPYTF